MDIQNANFKNTYTNACKASKLRPVEWWWTQDGNLGITIQDPPPESGKRMHLLYFTYSYCILSRVWKLATSLLVLRYYEHLFLFCMLTLHVTSSWFTYICWISITLPKHFHMHIQRHTHTSTHVQSAHKMNGGSQAQGLDWEGRKKCFVRDLAKTLKKHIKCEKQTDMHESKKRFKHIELRAKLLKCFSRCKESKINQFLIIHALTSLILELIITFNQSLFFGST